jgi:ParB-like chromosome segregation protein Spo0J
MLMSSSVKTAFRPQMVSLEIKLLVPLRTFDARERNHEKYRQIAASIAVVGVIEPLVVFPLSKGRYRVLDGRKRLDVLLQRKVTRVDCLLATEDEAYTYNRRVNYLSPVGEHQMILRALEHNTQERIAQALNVDVATIRRKSELLTGVCKDAVQILRDRRVTAKAFSTLKKMKPIRQVEAAQLMVASNMYSGRFALALLAGTKDALLANPENERPKKSVTTEQRAQMEQETENLIRDLRAVEKSYGTEVLTLSVACKYLARVLANARVHRDLERRHREILHEIESVMAMADGRN